MSGEARFSVRLTPRSGSDRVEGVNEMGELRVRVRAAPSAGAANRALLGLLAEVLGVSRSDVALERGATARSKRLRVVGVPVAELRRRWPGIVADGVR